MTRMKRLPLLLGCNGPRIPIDTSVKGSEDGKMESGLVSLRSASRFCAQEVQVVIVPWMSYSMNGQ